MSTPVRPRRSSSEPWRLRRAAFALLLLAAAGCGTGTTPRDAAAAERPGGGTATVAVEAPADPSVPALPVTVESADGRSVTVTDTSRILPLHGSLSEAVFSLGLGGSVVGRDISATFAEADGLPVVTRAHDVSAESVLSLRPTVVLADTDTGPPEALDAIRGVGIPVVVFEVADEVGDIDDRIVAVGEALGVPELAREVADDTAAEIAEVRASVDVRTPPCVAFLYLRGQASVALIGGRGSGADSMIEAAGGVDAGSEIGLTQPFTPITSEALVEAAPDVLLLTTTGLESVGGRAGLLGIPGVAQTPAGRAGRVVTIEDGLLYSFGGRTPDALRQLADGIAGVDP